MYATLALRRIFAFWKQTIGIWLFLLTFCLSQSAFTVAQCYPLLATSILVPFVMLLQTFPLLSWGKKYHCQAPAILQSESFFYISSFANIELLPTWSALYWGSAGETALTNDTWFTIGYLVRFHWLFSCVHSFIYHNNGRPIRGKLQLLWQGSLALSQNLPSLAMLPTLKFQLICA